MTLPKVGTLESTTELLERAIEFMRVDKSTYEPTSDNDQRIREEVLRHMKEKDAVIVLVDRMTEWTYVGVYREGKPIIYRLRGGDMMGIS